MSDDAKRKTLIFLLLTVGCMVLLAVALPRLDLKPGIPLPKWGGGTLPSPSESQPNAAISLSTFFKALLEAVGVIVALYCIYKFLKGVPWKEILGPALRIALLASLVIVILFAFANLHITPGAPVEVLPPELKLEEGPPLGPPPAILIWLVWIGLGLLLGLLGIWASKRRNQDRHVGDSVTLEAEYAMQALKQGRDFRSVIVQCYRQMSAALHQEQGLELENSMTAREFEQLLEAKGLPRDPVHQLTQLFEAARYSLRQFTPADEQTAFDCLSTIVQFSRERKPDPT
jgi:LPXTG-motif cell wall-anchored protein